MAAAYTTTGDWASKSDSLLTFVARTYLELASSRREVAWTHVKGHSENPWNEWADRLANAACEGTIRPLYAGIFVNKITCEPRHRVLWACEVALERIYDEALPPVNGTEFIITKPRPPEMEFFKSAAVSEPKVRKSNISSKVQFDIVQLNALTMGPDEEREESLMASGRIGYFDRLFYEEKANIIGLQEARTNGPYRSMPHFHAFISGRDPRPGMAILGTETWIAKSFPMVGNDKLIPVAKQDVVVSSVSPRHIFIAVRAAPLAFDVINVHALHSGYTVEKSRFLGRDYRHREHIP